MEILSDALQSSDKLLIKPAKQEALSAWFVQNLTDSCLAENYLVYSFTDSLSESPTEIQIANPEVDIQYLPEGRNGFFFRNKIKRKIVGMFHIRIVNTGGRIVVSRQIQQHYEDTIRKSALTEIENKKLPFTTGVRQVRSGLIKHLIEPITVTAATIAVVYLFYTQRGEKK